MELCDSNRKAEINMRFSVFEIPPIQDVLLIGKRAPIGPEAVRKMVEVLSPDQYEIIKIEHDTLEAIVIRKSLTTMISKDQLISIIIEEGGKITDESSIIKTSINVILSVSKAIDL